MKQIRYSQIIKELNNNSIKINSHLKEETPFFNLSPIQTSNLNELTFFSNIKYLKYLKSTKASACLISKEYAKYLPNTCKPIIVNDPYSAFAILSKLFFDNNNISNGIISNFVNINNMSKLSKNIQIDDFSCIDEDTIIEENVKIGSNTKIGPNVHIHKNSVIHDNVSISNSIIYENCEIQSGSRIGGSGFGFDEKSKNKIFHHGKVIINKNVTIGSNTTIDRAVFDSTKIGEFSQIDNLVQIAHNVIIGKHAIIAAQVGIAGSTIIGDNVKIGGQAGISGHLKIGNNVIIAAKSGVTKNIDNGQVIAGFPAKDINLWKREIIKINKLK